MQPSNSNVRGARIIAPRQALFLCSLVMLSVTAAGYVWMQRPLAASIALELRLVKNIGRIMTLDEVLTMSARMAAAGRDPAYEARYNSHVDELDRTIKATLALVDDAEATRFLKTTDAANLRLVEMETRAFELNKQGSHAAALALLEGVPYRDEKAVYAGGMARAFARMEQVTSERRAAVARRALLLQVAAVLSLLVLLGVWALEQRAQRRRVVAYASVLEATVGSRTAELAQRNRGMRLVLDNVAQGFVTIGLDGVMADERSAIVERWFGASAPGETLADYLRETAPHFAQVVELGLEQLRDGFLPVTLVIAQMPSRFASGQRLFDVAYSAIGDGESVERILVIISDATDHVARERAEREQQELLALFQRISIDRAGVEEFLSEAATLVGALRQEQDPIIQKRLVHTLKGNCAIYGLESYAELAHVVESQLAETNVVMSAAQCDSLVGMWKEVMLRVAPLLGSVRRGIIELDHAELDVAISQVQAGAPAADVIVTLSSWSREPIARRFERLARQITMLSRCRGIPDPNVLMTGESLRLDPEGWQPFWSAMIHVVRNAVDHGIENNDQRRRAGKPEAGTIEMGAVREGGTLVITVRDDGNGIPWEKVRARAAERNMPHDTHADLVEALFKDGLSTRDVVTDLSGRGVGMGSVRQAVRDLGGSIEVASTPGEGTTFRFSFGERRTTTRVAAAPRRVMTSLLPFLV